MGARLAAYYAEAEGIGGLDGKIQLAMLTRIPSSRALLEPDSAYNVDKFEQAMSALRRLRGPTVMSGYPPAQNPERHSGLHAAVPDAEELFWGVLGALHDSVVAIFEHDGRCLMVWESRSLEQRYPGTDGSNVGDTMARLVSSHFAEELRSVHGGAGAHQSELACTINGQRAWLSVSLSAASDSRGRVLGVHAFLQDITEQKRHEEGLRRSEARLREQARVYVELMARQRDPSGDLGECLRRITEAAARTLDVRRASVWFFGAGHGALSCADVFDGQEHLHGPTLEGREHGAFFEAARAGNLLAVHEAAVDPRTASLAELLFKPFQISSILAAPIFARGELVGLLCHEHRGMSRFWQPDEESCAHMLASFVSLGLGQYGAP